MIDIRNATVNLYTARGINLEICMITADFHEQEAKTIYSLGRGKMFKVDAKGVLKYDLPNNVQLSLWM